jgi:protocatechuate 3,4-dioxygenase beta subunit
MLMHDAVPPDHTRRHLIRTLALSPVVLAAPSLLGALACSGADATGASATAGTDPSLQPTLACADDDDDPTLSQTEGPYFTPNSPERTSLFETGMEGTRLTLTGLVLSTSCQPVSGALLDFWQADDGGNYDNSGYTLRGHQYTDASGAFQLETIVPGLYPGRTRHIHVKAQAPNQPVLTTQLYFPGEERNAGDGIFDESLLIRTSDAADGSLLGQFVFVLELG